MRDTSNKNTINAICFPQSYRDNVDGLGGQEIIELYDKAIKGRMWFNQMYESDEWIEKTLFEPFNNWLKQNDLYVDDQSSWNYLYLGFQDDYLSDHLGNLTFDMDQYDSKLER